MANRKTLVQVFSVSKMEVNLRHATILFLTTTALLFCIPASAQEKVAFYNTMCSAEDAGCAKAVVMVGSNIAGYASVRGNNKESIQFLVKFSHHTGSGKDRIEYQQITTVKKGTRTSRWEKSGMKDCTKYGQPARCPTGWETTSEPTDTGDLYKKNLWALRELETRETGFKGVAVNN